MQKRASANSMVQWADGLADGAIVMIEICRWRGITCDLSNIMNHNMHNTLIEKQINDLLKGLLPKNIDLKLRTAETKARNNLAVHSFPCDAFNNQRGRFIPATVYADFAVRNTQYCEEYNEAKEMLLKNYDNVLGSIIAGIAGIITKECGAGSGGIIDAIVRMLPTRQDIENATSYATVVKRISRQLTDSIASMNNTKCLSEHISLTEPNSICLIPSSYDEMTIDQSKMLISNDIRKSLDNKTLDRQADVFMIASAIKLRQMLYDGCLKIIASLDKNHGVLVGRASVMAHNMILSIQAMDFYGDADIKYVMNLLSYELDGRETRNKAALRSTFLQSSQWAKQSISYFMQDTKSIPALPLRYEEQQHHQQAPDTSVSHNANSSSSSSSHSSQKHSAGNHSASSTSTIRIPAGKSNRKVRDRKQ